MKENFSLPRSLSPEAVGISSQAIIDMVKELEGIDYLYHGLMILHGGVIASEFYRYPFHADETHCMYSVSKNVTATALGIAVGEGKISLDTKLIDIFPESNPGTDEYYNTLTIRHLVTMTAGKSPDAALDKSKGDWFLHFSQSKRFCAPGQEFKYVNENIYVLSACLKKVLGQGVNDYLTPRLWQPLGIEKPYWECDRNGIEAGGWGIQLKLEDLAKLALLYHNEGFLNGRQLIPKEWIRQAVLNQTPAMCGGQANKEEGYGYSIWRYEENRYHFEGMYGQEAIFFPKQDLIIVLFGGDFVPKRKNDVLCKYHEKLLCTPTDTAPTQAYIDFISDRALDSYAPSTLRSAKEAQLNGKVFKLNGHPILEKANLSLGVLSPAAVFMSKNRAGGITDVSFSFTPEGCFFAWREKEEKNTVFCAMNGGYHADKIVLAEIPFTAYSAAEWKDEKTLVVSIRPMQTIARRQLTFIFRGNGLTMKACLFPDASFILKSAAEGATEGIKNLAVRNAVMKLFVGIAPLLEPKTRGRIKKQ